MSFLSVLALAEAINYEEGLAKTYENLHALRAMQGRFDETYENMQQALDSYIRIGRQVYIASCKINAMFTHNLAEDYTTALQAAHHARAQFAKFTAQIPASADALINVNQAESHLGLGELALAESCALRAIALKRGEPLWPSTGPS